MTIAVLRRWVSTASELVTGALSALAVLVYGTRQGAVYSGVGVGDLDAWFEKLESLPLGANMRLRRQSAGVVVEVSTTAEGVTLSFPGTFWSVEHYNRLWRALDQAGYQAPTHGRSGGQPVGIAVRTVREALYATQLALTTTGSTNAMDLSVEFPIDRPSH